MCSPLTTLFESLEDGAVRFCVLRDAERLKCIDAGGEIDLLVHPADLRRASTALSRAGFIRLVSWGHLPHRFFIRYDAEADCWIKCDVVTSIAFGRPVHNLVTALGEPCLAGRQRQGAAFMPCPEDELVTLLLHCILDKREFRHERKERVQQLRRLAMRETRLQEHLSRYWPSVTWSTLAGRIDREEWAALLAFHDEITAQLRQNQRVFTVARSLRDRTLRRLGRCARLARPNAPSVALLAPDGAGKSTLVTALRDRFVAPVHSVYMGLYQGGSGRRGGTRLPGAGLARLLVTQWRRYLTARYRQAGGQLVLFDRYGYDARLPTRGDAGPLRRLRRWLIAHACPPPDLVVILDAPGDVLFARKGEHSPALLEEQRQAYLRMCRTLRRAAVVDARCDADELRRRVTALIWDQYRRKAGHGRRSTHDERLAHYRRDHWREKLEAER